jgi:hypothetical protein
MRLLDSLTALLWTCLHGDTASSKPINREIGKTYKHTAPHSGKEILMLRKHYLKSRKVFKVTFELPKDEIPKDVDVQNVHLVGEFNDWDPTATPMKYLKKGAFQSTLELEAGREYQFRYLVNGDHWCNEWHADAYIRGEFGEDNCIVNTGIEE